MTKKVLITGGAGFIGSHLSEAYLKEGWEVYVIDNLETGSLENITHLTENPEYKERMHIIIDTILNEEKMIELIGICSVVIHLAAAVGVKYILDNPLSSITTNVVGTELVIRLCDKFKKRLLIASTSEVYGKQSKAPLVETDDIVFGSSGRSRWSYAAGKLMDEFTALAYYKTTKLPVVIVRFFNTVGPRQTGQYGMVIPRFVQKALADETITVFGDGTQTRTFTHVDEVCQCIINLMEAEKAFGEVINIGGVEEISMKDLAERIIKKTGSSSKIEMVSYEEAYNTKDFEDMPRRVPSTEKLKSIIGFVPGKDLDEILTDVVGYFKKN